jgi:hypothetical protein
MPSCSVSDLLEELIMNTWRLLAVLSGLYVGIPNPACLGQQRAESADVGTVPQRHGIALFGVRSHHLDLATAILRFHHLDVAMAALGGPPVRAAQVLRSELRLRTEQLPKLADCLNALDPALTKDEEALDKWFDGLEELLLMQLPKVLDDNQQTRFEQLSCQFAGPMVLRLEHYASRLELSVP